MRTDLPATRSCGGCTACCSAVGVAEIEKGQGIGCRYCNVGAGCTVYERRPQECADFKCLWLDDRTGGELTRDDERPDLSGVVFTGTGKKVGPFKKFRPGAQNVLLMAFEAWPGAFDTYRAQKVLSRVSRHAVICLIRYGEKLKRTVVGPAAAAKDFAELQRIAERNAAAQVKEQENWREGKAI